MAKGRLINQNYIHERVIKNANLTLIITITIRKLRNYKNFEITKNVFKKTIVLINYNLNRINNLWFIPNSTNKK